MHASRTERVTGAATELPAPPPSTIEHRGRFSVLFLLPCVSVPGRAEASRVVFSLGN